MTRNARRRLFAFLAVAGISVMVGIMVCRLNSRNLVYQGKTVKAWLLQLSAPPDPKARDEAEAAFQALGTNAVPELARLLRADDASWRRFVWSHAMRLPRRLGGWVLQRVSPPSAYLIHPAAARALGRLGPGATAAEPDLVRALQDKVNATYWEAGSALGRIGKQAVPDLTRALQDPDTLVRCAAAHGLGEAGPDAAPAIPALIQMLKRGSPNEQQTVAQSLAKVGAPAVAPLIEMLAHEPGSAGEAAAGALLRHYHQPGLARAARENLPDDEMAGARRQAIETLGASGRADETVIKVLTAVARDPAPSVRAAALKALDQVKSAAPPK